MASQIDEPLSSRHQNRRPPVLISYPRDQAGRFQANSGSSGPVPMEIDVASTPTAMAKTAVDRIEYQNKGGVGIADCTGMCEPSALPILPNPTPLQLLEKRKMDQLDREQVRPGIEALHSILGRSSTGGERDLKRGLGR